MPKFIITQIDRYEIEAETIEEAQADWRRNLVDGSLDDYDFLDGSTTYEEKPKKVFVAKIEFEYEVDENNYLHWEDEHQSQNQVEARTLSNLLALLKDEFADTLLQIDIRDSVSIEEKGENENV
jgi:hypothetical protein